MPRPRNPANEAHRAEQERYRDRLKAARKPEAPPVDWAVAAAFALALSRLRDTGQSSPVLESVVADSKAILLGDGYSPNHAVRKLMSRLLYRDDLEALKTIATKPATGLSSPHYFVRQKRGNRVSRSEDAGAA